MFWGLCPFRILQQGSKVKKVDPLLKLDLDYLKANYPNALQTRYEIAEMSDAVTVLTQIAEFRKCYKKGDELDLDKAASFLLDDFRSGRIMRISLERPE